MIWNQKLTITIIEKVIYKLYTRKKQDNILRGNINEKVDAHPVLINGTQYTYLHSLYLHGTKSQISYLMIYYQEPCRQRMHTCCDGYFFYHIKISTKIHFLLSAIFLNQFHSSLSLSPSPSTNLRETALNRKF